jgi:hypothetical protein
MLLRATAFHLTISKHEQICGWETMNSHNLNYHLFAVLLGLGPLGGPFPEDNLNTVVAENEGFTPANRNKTHHLKQKNCKKLE